MLALGPFNINLEQSYYFYTVMGVRSVLSPPGRLAYVFLFFRVTDILWQYTLCSDSVGHFFFCI